MAATGDEAVKLSQFKEEVDKIKRSFTGVSDALSVPPEIKISYITSAPRYFSAINLNNSAIQFAWVLPFPYNELRMYNYTLTGQEVAYSIVFYTSGNIVDLTSQIYRIDIDVTSDYALDVYLQPTTMFSGIDSFVGVLEIRDAILTATLKQ